MIPYRIYISGGGLCGIAHVGALKELSNHISLKSVKEWMGVSAGSFLAMCICIGYTLDELYDLCLNFDFSHIKDYDSVPGCLLHFGIDTGDRMQKLIEACIHVKGLSSDFSFKQCYEMFGLSLKIVATDLNDAKSVVFSPVDTPDYKICYAVRASMSLPYYYQPFICPVTNHFLADGAVISNYPLFIIPKEDHIRTLSIIIRTSVNKVDDIMNLSIDELVTRPLRILLMEKANLELKLYSLNCIQIQLGDVNIMDFSFDEKTKQNIMSKGKESVIDYFKNIKIKRRNSI